MMFVTNLFILPFQILIWLIEAYLFFSAMRLVMSRSQNARQTHFYHQMKLLTDPLPNLVTRALGKGSATSRPSWLSWTIVILAACVLRQMLISMVLM
jgi:uncharacterized protein YggT (Ycf19 family)